jgi:hypothetical protein
VKKQQFFLDVIALAVNVIIIWISFESEETTVFFGCNRTSCKCYYSGSRLL